MKDIVLAVFPDMKLMKKLDSASGHHLKMVRQGSMILDAIDSKIMYVFNAPLGSILMIIESVEKSVIFVKRGMMIMEIVQVAIKDIFSKEGDVKFRPVWWRK